MKNKILLIISITFCLFSFSQEKSFFEVLGYPRVTLNKNLLAYTLHVKHEKGGKILTNQTIEPDINNPHYITITSNRKGGFIKLKNKGQKRDIFIEFEFIYQGEYENGSTPYFFISKSNSLEAYFAENNNYNDMLIITFNEGPDNEIKFSYTITDL